MRTKQTDSKAMKTRGVDRPTQDTVLWRIALPWVEVRTPESFPVLDPVASLSKIKKENSTSATKSVIPGD